jgi:1,2-diacylglycerol 3-beta-glucosyltransferase
LPENRKMRFGSTLMFTATAARILVAALAAYIAIWALYVVLVPVLGRLRPRPRSGTTSRPVDLLPFIVVLVPSHNMEPVIERCIKSLKDCDYFADRLRVHVIADHCTDDTAARARASGATLHVRNVGPPGKTFSIAWALQQLSESDVTADLYVITDATAHVEPGFLKAIAALWRRGEDIIVAHALVDTANQKWFAKCLGLTLVHRNMQNRARERLGLSALIEGRGMAYSRQYIQRFGWSLALPTSSTPGTHPTEDWRHGVRVVEHGYRVAFADEARVLTPLRESLSAATQQGVRWERGRMSNASSHGLSVLITAIKQRNGRMLLAALDAIQLPVAILGGLCVIVAGLTALVSGPSGLAILGYSPLLLLSLYGISVVVQGQRDGIPPSTIAWAPIYVLWRCTAFAIAMVSRRSSRTKGPATST